jgi:L-lactate dehydrogenase (cytochrome)
MVRLGHKDGELCKARGASIKDIPYCTSSYSSVSHEDIAACLAERKGGCLFFQLYLSRSKERTLELIHMAQDLGFKALVVTVDTPVVGKREEDERYKADVEYEAGEVEAPRISDIAPNTEVPILREVHSSTLDWEDLRWTREAWGDTLPVVLKGIQTAEDAKQAADLGIEGIHLSNHGGRQIVSRPELDSRLARDPKILPGDFGKGRNISRRRYPERCRCTQSSLLGSNCCGSWSPIHVRIGSIWN